MRPYLPLRVVYPGLALIVALFRATPVVDYLWTNSVLREVRGEHSVSSPYNVDKRETHNVSCENAGGERREGGGKRTVGVGQVVKEGGKPASQRERSDEGEGSGAREPIRNGPRVGQADGQRWRPLGR